MSVKLRAGGGPGLCMRAIFWGPGDPIRPYAPGPDSLRIWLRLGDGRGPEGDGPGLGGTPKSKPRGLPGPRAEGAGLAMR